MVQLDNYLCSNEEESFLISTSLTEPSYFLTSNQIQNHRENQQKKEEDESQDK